MINVPEYLREKGFNPITFYILSSKWTVKFDDLTLEDWLVILNEMELCYRYKKDCPRQYNTILELIEELRNEK